MKAGTYMHEAKNVSAVMGRKSDVSVVFAGGEAATDGNVIQLPSVNQEKDMSNEEVMVARGYVDHEAAHVKWTTDAYKKANMRAVKGAPEGKAKLMQATLNALEDVRIEEHLIDTYEGSRDHLDATADAVIEEVVSSMGPEELGSMPAEQIGPLAMTWYGRGRRSYGKRGAECFAQLSGEVQEMVMKAVDGLHKDSTPEDVVGRAKSFIEWVEAEAEQEESEGEGEGEGEGGEGSGEGSGEGEAKSEGEGGSSGEVEEKATSAGEPIDPSEASKEAVEKALASDPSEAESGNYYRRFTDAKDTVYGKDELRKDGKEFRSTVNGMTGQINVVRRKLERMLMARMKRDWTGGKLRGRLDTRRLVGAYGGEETVFKMREESSELDTAVCILVDHSGSMGGRIRLAQQATIALAEALEPTPIKLAITGFKTERNSREDFREYSKSVRDGHHFSSISPVAMLNYKEYDESLHRCHEELGGMLMSFGGIAGIHNIDGVSVEKAGMELANRVEKRKVLMVLSDGFPEDDEMDRSQMFGHLKSVVRGLEEKGVEVFGIGIESGAVRRFYDKCVVLNDISELETELIDRMSNVLVGGEWDARRVAS